MGLLGLFLYPLCIETHHNLSKGFKTHVIALRLYDGSDVTAKSPIFSVTRLDFPLAYVRIGERSVNRGAHYSILND